MTWVTPPGQKSGLCFNRKTLSLRRGPDLPGGWRPALSRAPADSIGGADALSPDRLSLSPWAPAGSVVLGMSPPGRPGAPQVPLPSSSRSAVSLAW